MSYRFAITTMVLVFSYHQLGWGQEQPDRPKPTPAQNTELTAIKSTLDDYIQGSTNGQPERLQKVFHPNLNLYSIRNQRLSIWPGKDYIADTKPGKPTGESGQILAIDYEHDTAVAKVKISPPNGTPFIDYFMLLKIDQKWTIIHKMYTRKNGSWGASGSWKLGEKPEASKNPKTQKKAS